jgi:hypothetical protein
MKMRRLRSVHSPLHFGSFARSASRQNQVDLEIETNPLSLVSKGCAPFAGLRSSRARHHDFSLQIVQSCEDRRRPVPIIILGPRFGLPSAQKKPGLSTPLAVLGTGSPRGGD